MPGLAVSTEPTLAVPATVGVPAVTDGCGEAATGPTPADVADAEV